MSELQMICPVNGCGGRLREVPTGSGENDAHPYYWECDRCGETIGKPIEEGGNDKAR